MVNEGSFEHPEYVLELKWRFVKSGNHWLISYLSGMNKKRRSRCHTKQYSVSQLVNGCFMMSDKHDQMSKMFNTWRISVREFLHGERCATRD
jgi:hypothetical protein